MKQFFDAEDDLAAIGESREAELEERARDERSARVLATLDDRSLGEVREIHAALQRMIDGTYGTCLDCGRPIAVARLRAVPATGFCAECAHDEERARPAVPASEPRHPGKLPPDLEPLLDRELEQVLVDLVRDDRRVEMDELRLVCRHGVVHLDGTVPSEAQHQILLKLVTDVAGLEEVVDRVGLNEFARPAPAEPSRPTRLPTVGTEDVVESAEEGREYLAPDRPPPEQE